MKHQKKAKKLAKGIKQDIIKGLTKTSKGKSIPDKLSWITMGNASQLIEYCNALIKCNPSMAQNLLIDMDTTIRSKIPTKLLTLTYKIGDTQ